jgi:hypothetical protein
MRSSTCRAVDQAGRTAGRESGLAESTSRTLAFVASRQARQKFGGPDVTGRATLDGLARASAPDLLGELAGRLVDASSWDQWLAGVVVPPPGTIGGQSPSPTGGHPSGCRSNPACWPPRPSRP